MQIVLPLADASHNDFIELRYALRSFQKYLTGIDQIYLIGGCPGWIKDVIHIPFTDIEGARYKENNIFRKTQAACVLDEIGESFLFCNDDQYLLSPFKAETFPYHYHATLYETLHGKWVGDPYNFSLIYAQKYLLGIKAPTLDFDGHSPLIYNKADYLRVVAPLNWSRPYGFVIKSIYCNQLGIKGVKAPDMKIRRATDKKDIKAQIKGLTYFSTDDRVMNDAMIDTLNSLFPKKSNYEK